MRIHLKGPYLFNEAVFDQRGFIFNYRGRYFRRSCRIIRCIGRFLMKRYHVTHTVSCTKKNKTRYVCSVVLLSLRYDYSNRNRQAFCPLFSVTVRLLVHYAGSPRQNHRGLLVVSPKPRTRYFSGQSRYFDMPLCSIVATAIGFHPLFRHLGKFLTNF